MAKHNKSVRNAAEINTSTQKVMICFTPDKSFKNYHKLTRSVAARPTLIGYVFIGVPLFIGVIA